MSISRLFYTSLTQINHYYYPYLERMCCGKPRRYIFHNFICVVDFRNNRSFFHSDLSVGHFARGFLGFFLLRGEIRGVAVVFGSCGFRWLFRSSRMLVFVFFVFLVFFWLVALVWAVFFVLVFVLFFVFFLGWSVWFCLVVVNSGRTVAFRRSKVEFGNDLRK